MQRIMLKSKSTAPPNGWRPPGTWSSSPASSEASIKHEPKRVFVDEQNRMLPTRKEDDGQSKLKCVH